MGSTVAHSPRPVGQPRKHDRDAIMQDVYTRIGRGELVLDVALSHGLHPDMLYQWGALPEYHQAYVQARVNQAHAMAEQAIKIADSAIGSDDAQAKRLQVDTRKWLTSKIAPKIYGEKLDVSGTVEHTHRAVVINYGSAPDLPAPSIVALPTDQPKAITSGLLSEVIPNDTPRSE